MHANKTLHELAQNIALVLEAWQYSDEQPYEHRAMLDGVGGAGLNLAWDGSNQMRLRIIGCWPQAVRHGGRVYNFAPYDRPRITVSASRPSTSIAKNIQRRLLPEYLMLWAVAVAARDSTLTEIEGMNRMLARLIEITGTQANECQDSVSFGRHDTVRGEVEIYGDGTVNLEIYSLPLDVACEILEKVLLEL